MMENTALAWAAIASGIIGPIIAVTITLVWERIRRKIDLQTTTLQNLLLTRGRYADPTYTATIRSIPIVFKDSKDIQGKHADFLNAARVIATDETRERISKETARREGILVSAIMKEVGLTPLTSEEIEAYTSEGLVRRETLVEDALRALPMIAISSHKSSTLLENSLTAASKNN